VTAGVTTLSAPTAEVDPGGGLEPGPGVDAGVGEGFAAGAALAAGPALAVATGAGLMVGWAHSGAEGTAPSAAIESDANTVRRKLCLFTGNPVMQFWRENNGRRAAVAPDALFIRVDQSPSHSLAGFPQPESPVWQDAMSLRRDPLRHPLAPMVVVFIAIGLFATMDALMKRASIATGVFPALLWRCILGALVLAPVWRWWSGGGAWPPGPVLRLHALRGAVVAGMAGLYFWGIVRTPLAEAIAISFIAPLLALFLAAILLGERVRPRAVAGSLVALGGVAVIAFGRVHDGGGGAEAGRGIAAILGAAVLYAWNLVLQRQQAQLASPLEIALFQNVFVALTMIAALPVAMALGGALPELALPASPALPDIAWSALLASVSVMLLAWAYARAEAQALVPLEYTAFPWSALTGWIWFAESVTLATLGGLALILAGVWIGARDAPQPQLPPA